MVGGDDEGTAGPLHRIGDATDGDVHRFGRGNRCLEDAAVADHVGVGDVADDGVVAAGIDRRHQLVGQLRAAHLRLQVVGGDLRAGDQAALFAFEQVLAAATEEEGDVRVLLGFGDAQLRQAGIGKHFAEGVSQVIRRERHRCRQLGVILGQADEARQRRATRSEAVERRQYEGRGQLARTIGTEIHEHHRVAIAHRLSAINDRGGDELVVLATRIRRLQRGNAARRMLFAARLDHRVPRTLHAVPALVAIHRVIAATHRCDACVAQLLAARLQGQQAGFGRLRWRVATVQERMHRHTCHPRALGQFQHREDVRFMAVHAAGREQAHHVQGAAARIHRRARRIQFAVVEEAGVLDRRVHAGQVLVNDAAGTQVHVPDFGIAHLPVRQAHMTAFGMDQRMRRGGQQSVPVGQLGLGQRIVFGLVAMPPAIQDQQDDGLRA